MTRVNLVPVTELADQHLFAEFRELKMVPKSLARSLRSFERKRPGAPVGELSVSHLVDMLRHGDRATGYSMWSNLRTGGFGYTVEDMLRKRDTRLVEDIQRLRAVQEPSYGAQ